MCISSGSCRWVWMSKGNVFHGQKEYFVFYGLGSSQNAVQPAILMDPVLRQITSHSLSWVEEVLFMKVEFIMRIAYAKIRE